MALSYLICRIRDTEEIGCKMMLGSAFILQLCSTAVRRGLTSSLNSYLARFGALLITRFSPLCGSVLLRKRCTAFRHAAVTKHLSFVNKWLHGVVHVLSLSLSLYIYLYLYMRHQTQEKKQTDSHTTNMEPATIWMVFSLHSSDALQVILALKYLEDYSLSCKCEIRYFIL